MTLLQKAIVRPHEEIARYLSGRSPPNETNLYRDLKARFGDIRVIQPLFLQACEINSHMGPWCSDFYWTFALDDKKSQKIESKIERKSSGKATSHDIAQINTEIGQIKEAIAFVSKQNFPKLSFAAPQVTPKLVTLYNFLFQYFARPSATRCIVFVERRAVARLLYHAFELSGGTHLRPGVLTGSGSGRIDDVQSTFRNQVLTLMKFRKGELNCLFATSVAEEGLDVPDCNLIVRFDICKTMIQYVQSRGRARHKNSRFLHMLEHNNSIHDRTLQDNRFSELLMRKYCEALPADRQLNRNEDLLGLEAGNGSSYTVPSTGAKVTFGSCLQLLGHFVSTLPKDGEEILQETYITTPHGGKYICEVKLPYKSPIHHVIGKLCNKKSLAKRSAAFEACVQLFHGGFLNENLVPIYTKKLPMMRNAALALNMKSTGNYTMRLKPSVWEDGLGSVPDSFYLAILDTPDGLERPHRPLILLSRQPLPDLPTFPLFLNTGRKTLVKSASFRRAVPVSSEEVDKLTTFTLRIFKDIFNKTYEFETAKMPYWLAPAFDVSTYTSSTDPSDLIDWATIDVVHANDGFEWTPETADGFLLDRFLIDRWDGGRRLFTTRLAPEYIPLDPVPKGTATGRWNANILDYSISLWSKARKTKEWVPTQPVIQAEKVLHRRNMLAVPDDKEQRLETKCFVCPEPLKISAVSITKPLLSSLTDSCSCHPMSFQCATFSQPSYIVSTHT